MVDGNPLIDRLANLTIIQDGKTLDGLALARRSEAIAQEMRKHGGGVALSSARADVIVMGLCAAQLAGCEVLLHRALSFQPDDDSSGIMGSTMDDTLAVKPIRNCPNTGNHEFRVLISTSGTTGRPKIARHTIESLLGRVRHAPGDARARWLLTYHPATFGGLQVVLTCLAHGAVLVTREHMDVPELASEAWEHQVTHISGTPTFWRLLLMTLGERAHLLPLKQVTLGGEIARQEILDSLRMAFPRASCSHIYASTEAGALFAVRDGIAGFPAEWLEVGVDDVELRIRDGVLEVRSPRAMVGYLHRNFASPLTEDGWLNTGDLVERTATRVAFRGRADSLLSVGGAKLHPEEIEAVLLSMSEVAEARVFGVPNPVTGMVVGAEVVPAVGGSERELRAAILGKLRAQLEGYKIPRILRLVHRIAVSDTGKKER